MKKISIVVPVYNVEGYIRTCLDSIVNQMSSSSELIIVNDGSSDSSLEICREYERKYSDIKIICQQNKGLSGARNAGIMSAQGEYIVFIDSDDYIENNALEVIEKYIVSNRDFYLIRSNSFVDGEDYYELNQIDYTHFDENKSPIEIFKELHEYNDFWFAAWLIVIRRDFLLECNLFFKEGIFHEDELWVPQVFLKSKQMGFINQGLYDYRTCRNDSIIFQKNIKKELDKGGIIKELQKDVCDDATRELIYDRCASLTFGMIQNYLLFEEVDKNKQLRETIKDNLSCLRWKKYRVIYWCVAVIGLRLTCKLINKVISK